MSKGARSYQVVTIAGEGDPRTAAQTALVLALFTLGVEAVQDCPFMETIEVIDGQPVRRHNWMLHAKSRDGKYETAKLRAAWDDPERAWFKANPEHPFTWLNGYARQQEHVSAQLAQSVPMAVVKKGDKTVLIPIDATPDEEAFLLKKLA